MDDEFRGLGSDASLISSYTLEALSKVEPCNGFCADTTLCLDSPGTSIMFGSNTEGTKRKWHDMSGTDGSKCASLALTFGHSSRSFDSSTRNSDAVCTMLSAKEIDEGCSMDLSLNLQLHLGGDSAPSTKNPSFTASKTYRTGLDLNLQLSLSVGPSESTASGVTTAFAQQESILDKSLAVSQGLTVGNVSTSACWRSCSNLSLCLTALEIPAKVNPFQDPDLSSTKTETPSSPLTSSSRMVTQRQKRNISTKNCEVPGCVKGARGATGLCIAHGGGRRCKRDGCNKGAEGKTIYCKAHGGGRRCQKLGCTKSAEGRTDFCIAHGGGRRCTHEWCTRAARGKSGLCIRHGGGKRCQKENCTKSAEGYSGLCISHGGGRRCQYLGCTKGAQGSTMLCKAHGGGKRCIFPECKKGAEGSTPFCKSHGGGKRCTFQGGCTKSVHGGTQFCVAHGGGKRCAMADCTKSARGRTNYCVRHGGGKRCKSVGCDKSAQGATDFCKAHGGGKKCMWGQLGSGLGLRGPPCDHSGRGKIGLCALHGALVQDQRIHGGATLGPLATPECQTQRLSKYEMKMKGVADDEAIFLGEKKSWQSCMLTFQPGLASLPESRVHGGNLMAMLASSSEGLGNHVESSVGGGSSHLSTKHDPMAHCWV